MNKYSIEERMNKWNWGAFFLTWIWGFFNKTYISTLVLLPIANLIMPFYLGSNGTILAWENGDWYDEESFLAYQKKWAIAGFITLAISLVITTGVIYSSINKQQTSINTANEIMEYVLAESTFKENLSNDYKLDILGESSIGDKKISFSFILISGHTFYWVRANYLDNDHIDNISITNSDTNVEINILVNKKQE